MTDMDQSLPLPVLAPFPPPFSARKISTSGSQSTISGDALSFIERIDPPLLSLTASLHIVSAGLFRLLSARLERIAEQIAADASKVLSPGEALVTTVKMGAPVTFLADVQVRAMNSVELLADVRSALRFFGFWSIWRWIRTLNNHNSNLNHDRIMHFIRWSQACISLLALSSECTSFLARKRVLPNWRKNAVWRWWDLSGRLWAITWALNLASIFRLRALHSSKDEKGKPVTEVYQALAAHEKENLKDELHGLALYAPLVANWCYPLGHALPQELVGVLGLLIGVRGIFK